MKNWDFGIRIGLGLLFILVVVPLCRAVDPELESIFSDWKRRQQAFDTVRYTVTGTVEFKDKQNLPAGNPIRPKEIVLLLDFKNKRFRHETRSEGINAAGSTSRWFAYRNTTTFDGRESRGTGDRDDYPLERKLSIFKWEHRISQFDTALLPLFYAHGIVPNVYGPHRIDKWPVEFDPDNFELFGRQSLKGRNCRALRTMPFPGGTSTSLDEFWIDRERNSAIARWSLLNSDSPWMTIDVEWQQIGSAWLPKSWTDTWMNPLRITRLEVKSFEGNPKVSDRDFTIPLVPGMLVTEQAGPSAESGLDPRYPAKRIYRVTPSGSTEIISEKGYTTFDGDLVAVPSPWRVRAIWCMGACLIVGACWTRTDACDVIGASFEDGWS